MKRRTVLATGAVALAGCNGVLEGPDAKEAADLVRESINEERQAEGVGQLQASSRLQEAGLDHSKDMAERDFYGHQNPDGEQPWDRVACEASENIHRGEIGEMKNENSSETWQTAVTEELAAFVIEGWKQSDSHYQNMTSARWSAIGVGIHIREEEEFFVTAMFC